MRAAGLDVRFAEQGERLELGTGHQIAVYRIAQEGLTNALRHGDVSAPVDLAAAPGTTGGVELEVVNAMRPDAATAESHGIRHGIPGMRERAQLAGGSLSADAGDDGMFRRPRAHPGAGEAARMSDIRVALVDDQALFRAGVRMLVESQADLEVAGEAGDGVAAVELAVRARPDVMLMDVRMPLLDGIAATERILADADRDGRTPPRILVLTTFDLDENAARAIRAGASGFVLKDADPEFLLAAIRTVHQGNQVIAATATRELFAHVGRGSGRRPAPAAWSDADPARTRDLRARRARPVELRDRRVRVPLRGDREDPREPHPGQARPARPGAARGLRLRARPRRLIGDVILQDDAEPSTGRMPRRRAASVASMACRSNPPTSVSSPA